MTQHGPSPDSDDGDEPLVRAFLRGPRAAEQPESTADERAVRAFVITNGRTTTAIELAFESMLTVTEVGRSRRPVYSFERAAIMDLCDGEQLSVAELAAKLRVPIGTMRVLAADLVGEKALEAFMPREHLSGDVALLRRLIHGVRAL